MPNIILITNPKSGNGTSIKAAHIAQQTLASKRINVHIAYTEYEGHATLLAKSFIANFDIIVAIGDDETVNEVAQALVGTDRVLGIIPCGSGNGLAKHLGIPMILKKAIKIIYNKKVKSIDAPKINDQYFFTTAGVGFGTKISHNFRKFNGRDFKNYFKSILMDFQLYSPQQYTIDVNGKKISSKAFVISLAEEAQQKDHTFISPPSKAKKGVLEATILSKSSLFKNGHFGFNFFKRKAQKSPEVIHLQSDDITIDTTKKRQLVFGHKDGETEKWSTPLNFKFSKGDKLNVIVH
ncbi:diacylglycerol/lipid kinase family protein [Flammeovirga aprica]|uniref:YegS/Rv2252/BmrU family lipid kinase n=1 Tax=Flammeovirga aprica JL-4 TaxID=694437 RepID=A0A7X9RZ34_9BACT|nr:YegS/Rv2252/BmrU family lipid kinase [Flammeovirga aprica]NME71346.1 YegS/Rv2252/BmrU family lipid kinase [Flammeovirga aprica JL-4]